jgi:SRSO17 transposase
MAILRSARQDRQLVVTVQLAFSSFDTRFRTMLDTELFLPEIWSNDRQRCRKAGIPDDVVYRPKHRIALELLDRSDRNGVYLEWITAEIWYSEKPDFLAGLEQRHHRYVVEIPRNLQGWLYNPSDQPSHRARGVEELCHHPKQMIRQEWTPFHIKNTDKGPMVWQVKSAPFWLEPWMKIDDMDEKNREKSCVDRIHKLFSQRHLCRADDAQ